MSKETAPQSPLLARLRVRHLGCSVPSASGNHSPKSLPITAQERHRMIARLAYYIAQRRAFTCGDPVQDWLEAERQIEAELAPHRIGDPATTSSKSPAAAQQRRKGKKA
jgi:hypothetical protein